jgi:dipeptidyl aminopeptidase/acylaminoacyl peptidase
VEDGFDHLVAKGLAEADRACIFGYSYGGYAAMAAATLTPEKYQCVIAAAGVSDLLAFLRRERREEGSNSEAYQYWVAHIGHPGRDKETIKAVSPVEHAGNLSRPLLILHGKDDGVVDYEQAERMDKALRKAGKFFRLVTLENSSHSYMPEKDELTYYTEILAFLETHLPVN